MRTDHLLSARRAISPWARSTCQLLGVLMLLSGLAGCSKSKEASKDKQAKTEQSESSETSAVVKPPEPTIPDEEIPTEEDFEADVERQIKPDTNLPQELDKLEKEIGD